MAPISDETKDDVRRLKKAVFGDTDNMKETPGIISELSQMNSILTDVRDSMRRINWVLITAFVTALCVLVFKGVNTP